MALVIYVGRELPTWDLYCLDSYGTPVDLSTATAITVQLRIAGVDTTITGTATTDPNPSGTGSSSSDVPSLNFAPAAGQLDSIGTGKAAVIVVATFGTLDREFQFDALINT